MDIYEEIKKERIRQDAKWGEQNHDDFTWVAVITEEVGEASEAALDRNFGYLDNADDVVRAERLIEELIQVAAVAVSWIECIGRGKQVHSWKVLPRNDA